VVSCYLDMKYNKIEPSEFTKTRAVLNIIEKKEKLSRAGIAKKLGLSRTTLSTLVNRLIESGIIKETGTEAEGIGRPGISLDIATDQWYAIGAEYHSGQWVFVITDLKGYIYKHISIRIPRIAPKEFLESLIKGLSEIVKEVPGRLLPAIGIGTPGFVDCALGNIIQASDLGWKHIIVKDYVKKHAGYDSYIINRHRASGLAEARFGAGRGVHSLVYIGIGTGISSAIISDGILLHGTTYSAGEIGYMVINPTGSQIQSEQQCCLHTLSSGTAMKQMAHKLMSEGQFSSLSEHLKNGIHISGELIAAEAAHGDPLALSCLQKAAAWLGIAVMNLNTTLNPDKIIFGGPIGGQKGPFVDMIRKEAEKWMAKYPIPGVIIERGILGNNTGALGAACLVLDKKLDLILGGELI
jgi:predicted NBD/HSP70 family sugar kinase